MSTQHRDGEIVRDETGAAVAMLLSSTLPPDPNSSVHKRTRACLECGKDFRINPCHAEAHQYCSAPCRAKHYRAIQASLDFTPPVRRADDIQAARLQRKALALLEALQAGPLTNVEAMRIGGLRFGARLHELRRAKYRIETEEHKDTGITVYRLEGQP